MKKILFLIALLFTTYTTYGYDYVNIVNGNGYADCNKQLYDRMGNQRYSCSYGGGCGVNGQPANYNNTSANPNSYGACILLSDRNNYSTNNTNYNYLSNREIRIVNLYDDLLGYEPDLYVIQKRSSSNYSISEIRELIKKTDEYKRKNPTYNNYVNVVSTDGYAECNNQIYNKMGNQRYSCSYGGGCGVNGLPASYNNPSANPYRYGACILETERNTYTPTTQTTYNNYVNVVNGNGYAECNNQIYNKMGNQRYSCSYGGGCGVNGQPSSYNNPSANPYKYGACILETEWNRYYNPNTGSTNNSFSTNNTNINRENQVKEAYKEVFGYYPDNTTLMYWTGTYYSVSMIKELLKQEYKSKNNSTTTTIPTTNPVNNGLTNREKQINDIYLELLGRRADEQGLKYRSGTYYSVSMIKELIKKSDEYRRR